MRSFTLLITIVLILTCKIVLGQNYPMTQKNENNYAEMPADNRFIHLVNDPDSIIKRENSHRENGQYVTEVRYIYAYGNVVRDFKEERNDARLIFIKRKYEDLKTLREEKVKLRDSLIELKEEAGIAMAVAYEKYIVAKSKPAFLPARRAYLARYLANEESGKRIRSLQTTSLAYNPSIDGASIFSELASGYIGPVRLSFGAMVAKTEMEEITTDQLQTFTNEQLDSAVRTINTVNNEKLTAQNILSGGGNALINMQTPIFLFNEPTETFQARVILYNRIGLTFPEIGTISTDLNVNNQFGFEGGIMYTLLPDNDKLPLSLFINGQYSWFLSKGLADVFGYENGFQLGVLTLGLDLGSRFRFAVDIPKLIGKRPKGTETTEETDFNEQYLNPTIKVSILPFN